MTDIPPYDADRSKSVGPAPPEPIDAQEVGESSDPSDLHGEWWIDGPIFSVDHKGSRMTSLRPGAQPGRFTASMIARLTCTFVFWIGLAFLALPRIVDPIAAPAIEDLTTHWWWWMLVILAVVTMVVLGPTFGFTRRAMAQYGQLGLPAVTTALVTSAAFLIALPFSIRFAVKTQRTIVAIRTTGVRYAGWLEHLDFRHGQIGHLSQFSVRVGFETSEGPRVVTAQMEAIPDRVPLEGESLLVIVSTAPGRRGSRERILIEPDPDQPMRFDPDSGKYVVTADGGGG